MSPHIRNEFGKALSTLISPPPPIAHIRPRLSLQFCSLAVWIDKSLIQRALSWEPDEAGSALGRLGDRVPAALRVDERTTTLAARRIARVSATPAALSLAWEAVSVHVNAADITHSDTSTHAAAITASAREVGPLSIDALGGWQPPPSLQVLLRAKCQERILLLLAPEEPGSAFGVSGDRIPAAFRMHPGATALAARRIACVS